MNPLAQEFKKYLDQALGIQVTFEMYGQKGVFPIFLQGLYDFYQTRIFNKAYLLAIAKGKERSSAICKHIWLAQEKAGIPCIYLGSVTDSINYKRLISHRILFVIPGKQIYLPEIGIDWVENCRSRRLSRKFRGPHKQLSPVAQTVIIYALTHQNQKKFALRHLAKILSYAPMSISRALDELEGHELGATIRENKERLFNFTAHGLWESSYLLLKSPVRKRVWIQCKEKPPGILAGLSALANLTHLAEPQHPIHAMSYKQWSSVSFKVCEEPDDADIEIEIWHYDPSLFATSGHVDPFSLYLSLRELQDERVEDALETMMSNTVC